MEDIRNNKIKINIIRLILFLLLMLTFCMIFGFSEQNGEQSSGISRKITQIVTKNIKSIQELDNEMREIKMKEIEHIIRKLAHFSIYTVVGILLMLICKTYRINDLKRFLISLCCGIIYASSDEIHQIFVPGRTAMVTDVLIDTSGVILGILIVFGIFKIARRNGKEKN